MDINYSYIEEAVEEEEETLTGRRRETTLCISCCQIDGKLRDGQQHFFLSVHWLVREEEPKEIKNKMSWL